jgi:hypothetical protein
MAADMAERREDMAADMADMVERRVDSEEERRVDSAVAMAEATGTSRHKRMLLLMSRRFFYIVASLNNIMLSIRNFSFPIQKYV